MKRPHCRYAMTVACLGFLLLITGCQGVAKSDAASANREARLQAALSILDVDERDKSLGQLAMSAATAGDGAMVNAAGSRITDVDRRDQVAAEAALRLARAGDAKAAHAVAMNIIDVDKRDRIMKKLAAGVTR